MKEYIKQAINKIYKDKGDNSQVIECQKSIELPHALVRFIDEKRLFLAKRDEVLACTWSIQYDHFKQDGFRIFYKTQLSISKICPVFYIQHNFKVYTPDKNTINNELSGFEAWPLTKEQYLVEEKIKKELIEQGYEQIEYKEMIEVVMPFQMTVENLLFKDLFDLCDGDEQ